MTVVINFVGRVARAAPRAGVCAALLALGLLAGCGGSGTRVEDFKPSSLLVFGDETSVIRSDGARYTVNDVTTDSNGITTINCRNNRIWVQIVADEFDFGFAECPNPNDTTPPRGRIYAQPETGIASLVAQINLAIAERGSFKSSDLVTVYTGQKDLFDLFLTEQPTSDECRFTAGEASSAGRVARQAISLGQQVAQQVKRISNGGDGGRVLFVTMPNISGTPEGRNLPVSAGGATAGSCLNQLSQAFNSGLRSTVPNDGRYFGLVLLDDLVGQALNGFDNDNDTTAVCSVPLPDCTENTLIAGVSSSESFNYLWAGARNFGVNMHDRFGDLARDRARDNPFSAKND
jgi:hypothetical protein